MVIEYCEDLGSYGVKARIEAGMFFNSKLDELENSGFKVFGKRVYKKLKDADDVPWIFAYISILRSSNPSIIDLDEIRKIINDDSTG